MRKTIASGIAAGVLFASAAAFAAGTVEPTRGTIASVNGSTLSITDTAGKTITLNLAPGAKVVDVIPASIADVKANTYVGTAAVKQPNGEYRAMELQIFPESMRGVGLGTRAWNLKPKSSMTNGTVGGLTHAGGTVGTSTADSGNLTLTVNDGSGEKKVLVPAGVPVVSYAPGTPAELKPGAHVIFFGTKGADGAYAAKSISVGKDGLVPPM